jgi:hypothetical protein
MKLGQRANGARGGVLRAPRSAVKPAATQRAGARKRENIMREREGERERDPDKHGRRAKRKRYVYPSSL